MAVYISLFTVAIPVNYTSEFREIFEAIIIFRCTDRGGYGHEGARGNKGKRREIQT